MLFLLFQIGADRYALDTSAVLEVAPCVGLKAVPRAPVGVAGLLDYHGMPVPVLDLHEMATGQRAEPRFSTRLILVHVAGLSDAAGQPRILGLLAERATGTLQRQQADFVESGLRIEDAPYLGPVAADAGGFIQCVRLEGLLTPPVRALLSCPLPEESAP
jgi:chemotaxis-related protein WspB